MDREGLINDLESNPLKYLEKFWPAGKLHGNEYRLGDIYGQGGESFAFNIETCLWSDFASGDSGKTVLNLYARSRKLNHSEALKELCQLENIVEESPGSPKRPPPDRNMPPALRQPNAISWMYQSGDGLPLFYIQRVDKPGGGKDFFPWTWSPITNEWTKKASENRVLYDLPQVIEAKQVIIVEGEKAAEACKRHIPETPAVAVSTWAGGSNAYKKTSWTPLADKDVILWPDNDEAGKKAMEGIVEILKPLATRIRTISVDKLEPKADAADMNFSTKEEFMVWMNEHLRLTHTKEVKTPEVLPAKRDIGWALANRDSTEGQTELKQKGLSMSKGGKLYENYNNVFRVIETVYPKEFWWDDYRGKLMTTFRTKNGEEKEFDDDKLNHVVGTLQGMMPNLKEGVVNRAITSYSRDINRRNSGIEWIEGLIWDGTLRVEGLFSHYMGVEDSQYVRDVSRNLMVGIIARIIEPGVKFDNIIVLEGHQGIKKSTFLETLATPEFFHSESSTAGEEMILRIEGKMIVELAELSTLSIDKVDRVKALASTRHDRVRRKYDKNVSDIKRTAIWVGTTNHSIYLKDETGNRRYWPLATKYAKIEELQSDRDQLFAEAYKIYNDTHDWWTVDKECATKEQAKRTVTDAWMGIVDDYLAQEQGRGNKIVRVYTVATEALRMERRELTLDKTVRIERILGRLNYNKMDDALGIFEWRGNES